MLIVRSLRQDRVAFCVAAFIINNLGSRFVEPPVLDMKAVSVCVCDETVSGTRRRLFEHTPLPLMLSVSLCVTLCHSHADTFSLDGG